MRQLNPAIDLSRYQGIVFDFDGTLAPCLDLRAMKRKLLDFTIRETGIPRENIESMMMVEFIEYTSLWLEERGTKSDYFDKAHRLVKSIELEAASQTRLFPGTSDLLERLKIAGIRLGVVTRNCDQAVRTMYPEVDKVCVSVVAREKAHYLKPDPRHLQQCLNEMRVPAEACLMVGDGIIDIQIAKAMDVASLAVTSGHNSITELKKAKPDWLLTHVNELSQYL